MPYTYFSSMTSVKSLNKVAHVHNNFAANKKAIYVVKPNLLIRILFDLVFYYLLFWIDHSV